MEQTRVRSPSSPVVDVTANPSFISSFAVAPPGRLSKSSTLAALMPSRVPAPFARLGAFLAGVAFLLALAFLGATLRAGLARLALGLAFGASATGTRAV
jgi:hypothetical protein